MVRATAAAIGASDRFLIFVCMASPQRPFITLLFIGGDSHASDELMFDAYCTLRKKSSLLDKYPIGLYNRKSIPEPSTDFQ
jgi:hypothetical protein